MGFGYGAVQRTAYFFGLAPALVAPSFFNAVLGVVIGWGVFSWQLVGGGMKRFDIFSRRMRLIFSSWSWCSMVFRRLVRVLSVDFICFSIAARMVFGGVGFSVARMVAVSSAALASRCLVMTRFRFREMALCEYWVTYAAWALKKQAWMAVCSRVRRGCFNGIGGVSVFVGKLVGGRGGNSSGAIGEGIVLGTEA